MQNQLYTYVRIVGDLPGDRDFMACLDGEHLCVFLRRGRISARVLERAWDAARECSQQAGLVAPVAPRDEVTGLPVPFGRGERPSLTLVHSA